MTTNGNSFTPDRVRNVALCGHGGSGKTSLTEALLYCANVTSRLGRVEDGTTVTDFDPDEVKRHISVSTAIAPLTWEGTKINLLDTPGYADFLGDVIAALRVADGAVIVMDATAGVEVGTEQVWKLAAERNLPRIIFMNKIDRENANFVRAVQTAREAFGKCVVPMQVPIGEEKNFRGIADVLHQRAVAFSDDHGKPVPTEVPAELEETIARGRQMLVEAIVDLDEELMMRYLEDEPISDEEIARALKEGIRQGEIVPVMCGSATMLQGTCLLLDEILELIPAAAETTEHATSADGEVELTADPNAPLVAFAFKTVADPHVGRVTYFRVYQGTLSSNSHVTNATRGEHERIGQVFHVRGKEHINVDAVGPGDIAAVGKLTNVLTGDTIVSEGHPVTLTGLSLPSPSYAVAVHPTSKGDLDKLGPALQRLVEEDPTLHLDRDPITHEAVLRGLGEPHVQIAIDRMSRRYNVSVQLGMPRVAYRETITTKVTSEYKHKKQTGGAGQYGHVILELEPLPDADFAFEERVVGGAVPKNFFPAVEKGVREAMESGPLAGFPVVNVKATLVDGSYHPVDSNEMSFKIAAREALKRGVLMAKPVLQEPIMRVAITVPDSMVGDIMGDLNSKRAQVSGMQPGITGMTVIEAEVPEAEIQRYATDLRSLTQGRGSFTSEFVRYQPVPPNIAEQVRAAVQKDAA